MKFKLIDLDATLIDALKTHSRYFNNPPVDELGQEFKEGASDYLFGDGAGAHKVPDFKTDVTCTEEIAKALHEVSEKMDDIARNMLPTTDDNAIRLLIRRFFDSTEARKKAKQYLKNAFGGGITTSSKLNYPDHKDMIQRKRALAGANQYDSVTGAQHAGQQSDPTQNEYDSAWLNKPDDNAASSSTSQYTKAPLKD